jgi:hypothetical protein
MDERLVRCEIRLDERFRIAAAAGRQTAISQRKILDYEVTNIRLGDIRRNFHDEGPLLNQTRPYKYMMTGDTQFYVDYIYVNNPSDSDFWETRDPDSVLKDELSRIDRLAANMEKNGYDPQKGIIVVRNPDNEILDGQHRACWLLKKYGPDKTIPVLRLTLA